MLNIYVFFLYPNMFNFHFHIYVFNPLPIFRLRSAFSLLYLERPSNNTFQLISSFSTCKASVLIYLITQQKGCECSINIFLLLIDCEYLIAINLLKIKDSNN
ncbi:hypothetical protein BpHYR1_020647 [Brachionus plicatilis]|uniref:Uncharacterized protein n=1 Tax=Brachionus plicatilis TaxID=10195 RepID=A0A3M7QBS5_BRAPC|nr:hypothetical protein BpHYR1_020647 [Brachionus plicatilis]